MQDPKEPKGSRSATGPQENSQAGSGGQALAEGAKYRRALSGLVAEIVEREKEVTELWANLEDQYNKGALKRLCGQFEALRDSFKEYMEVEKGPYYAVLHRSQARVRIARQLISSANKTALLFHRYSQKPEAYTPVASRNVIKSVLNQLKNLKSYCKAQS